MGVRSSPGYGTTESFACKLKNIWELRLKTTTKTCSKEILNRRSEKKCDEEN